MPLLFYSPRREHFALQSGSSNQGRAAGDAGAELYAEAVRRWEAVRSQVAADYGWLAGENVARSPEEVAAEALEAVPRVGGGQASP